MQDGRMYQGKLLYYDNKKNRVEFDDQNLGVVYFGLKNVKKVLVDGDLVYEDGVLLRDENYLETLKKKQDLIKIKNFMSDNFTIANAALITLGGAICLQVFVLFSMGWFLWTPA